MSEQRTSVSVGSAGIGLGAVIGVVMSFTANHSILWATVHGIFGWFYVIYRALGYGGSY